MVTFDTGPGTTIAADGVTCEDAMDVIPDPLAFMPVTVKVYVVSFVSPMSIVLVGVAPTVETTTPAPPPIGIAVTV